MRLDLSGKVAVVTGAGRGLGRAVALRLAGAGADVVVSDIDLEAARRYGQELGPDNVEGEIRALGRRAVSVEGDLSKRAKAALLIERAITEFGKLDILVNNAGGAFTPMETSYASLSPDEDMQALFGINYAGAVYCCQAALPHMRGRKSGSIVNIASVAGAQGNAAGALAHYGASKAAVINYSRTLAAEVGPDGVRVNVIAPGIMMTPRVAAMAEARGIGTSDQAQRIPLRRLGDADDVAKAALFFASDLAGYVTGQVLAVNGGATLSPT